MKVIKPQKVGALHRVLDLGREHHLVVSAFLFVPLTEPRRLLAETHLYRTAAAELGEGAPIDAGMPKPSGEMLATGRAFVPTRAPGAPQHVCNIRVKVGEIDKSLYVIGDRTWEATGPSSPADFTSMEVSWERAFGGAGFARNPAGKGAAAIVVDGRSVHPLPNVEDPRRLVRSPADRPDPAGFAPIPASCPQRDRFLGTYDARWLEERAPGFAADLDPRYFHAGARDQRLTSGFFTGDETFAIENMNATRPAILGALPGLVARVFVTQLPPGAVRAGRPPRAVDPVLREVEVRLDTVHFFPSSDRCLLVWRGVVRVSEDDAADIRELVVACEERGHPKPVTHYAKVLAKRLDPERAHLYTSRDVDLLPWADRDEPDPIDAELVEMYGVAGIARARASRAAGREQDRAPEPPEPLEIFAAKEEAQRAADAEERAEKARAVVDAASLGGAVGPPRFAAASELASMRASLASARANGRAADELAALVEDPSTEARLAAEERQLRDAYRRDGHKQSAAPRRTLDESIAARDALRAEIDSARAAHPDAPVDLRGRDLTGVDLSDMDLERVDLSLALLESASLARARLADARLSGAMLARADLSGATLVRCALQRANLGFATIHGADLSSADLSSALIEGASLREARLTDARLEGVTFGAIELVRCDLSGASLRGVAASKTRFEVCRFDGCDAQRTSFVDCDLRFATFDGANLERATFTSSTLDDASFAGAKLHRLRLVHGSSAARARFGGAELALANLRGTDLRFADFSDAELGGADLGESDLEGARFHRARAKDARFVRADLARADFTSANLMFAILAKANLPGASFVGANLFRADLARVVGDDTTSFTDANVTGVRHTRAPEPRKA